MTPREHVQPESGRQKTVSDEVVLKIAKEIAVKFIEVGRLTPATFETTFTNIYTTINNTVGKD